HKMWCDIYDNSKIKKVKNWRAEIPFSIGIQRTIDWYNQESGRKKVSNEFNGFLDYLCSEFSAFND
ncbi:MAG: hypothetical protein WB290_05370, partial [Smithella sp.]